MSEGWKPIETMPKDGSKFDVWVKYKNHVGYVESYRLADCSYTTPYHYKERKSKKFLCAWEQVDYDGIEGWEPVENATHWMEIPEGPKE